MITAIVLLILGVYFTVIGAGLIWAMTCKYFNAVYHSKPISISSFDNYRMWSWLVIGVVLLVLGFHYLP